MKREYRRFWIKVNDLCHEIKFWKNQLKSKNNFFIKQTISFFLDKNILYFLFLRSYFKIAKNLIVLVFFCQGGH